ncbi:MAG: dTDP-glucose 4,6-dehydratase [Patescibacteria group bacterium]|nr:dTDP-glucose 4,6-dehydratase [Patescibacteria group bacterium]
MRKILVTGAAGFIGSAFVHWVIRNKPDIEIVSYDKLTYAGNLENLKEVEGNPRHVFVKGDIGDLDAAVAAMAGVDTVVHFAAETHNDRSVLDPGIFSRTNVLGTQILCEAARQSGISRFHHISTDEVYGDLGLDEPRRFKETDRYNPRTPYSASKAGSDHVVNAYFHTFGLPITISHCANNYGPCQFPEKLVPLFTTNALEDKPMPLFQSSQYSREWIHADDHSAAVWAILEKGRVGETYDIGSGVEKSVEQMADLILEILGKPKSLKSYVPDRPGHDRRYAIDSTKIRTELGWSPAIGFDDGLRETVLWYRDNPEWWQRVKDGAYQKYYEEYYVKRLDKG